MADRWTPADLELVKLAIGDCRYDEGSDDQAAAVLDKLVARGWGNAHKLEAPGSILCDCDPDRDDHRPTNPTTGAQMDHHCDCTAVEAVAQMLGETATIHHRQCVCLRPRGDTGG